VLPGFKAMSEEIKKPVEIAVREFDRDPNRISKNLFQELQVVEKIPIREVMDANSNPNTSRKSSRVSHSQLQTLAKRNELLDDKGALDNLAGSYAEAIALKEYRGDRIFGSAIYEPVSKGKKIIQEISKVTQGFIPKQVVNRVLASFNDKTPDILAYGVTVTVGGTTFSPRLLGVVNPNNINQIETVSFLKEGEILIAPVEVTIASGRSTWKQLKPKAEKAIEFSQVFKGIPGVNYVPILDMDRESFSKLKLDNRRELVSMMKEAGGYVVVREGFAQRSRNAAYAAAVELTGRVRELNNSKVNQKDDSSLLANSESPMQRMSSIPEQNNESFGGRLSTTKSAVQPITSTFQTSPQTQQIQSSAKKQPDYQSIVVKVQEKAHKFLPLGLKVSNEQDLYVAIAITSNLGGWDAEKTLKQSPHFQNLSLDKGEDWLKGVMDKANELLPSKSAESSNFSQPVKTDQKQYER
jgi:hypothetical protein